METPKPTLIKKLWSRISFDKKDASLTNTYRDWCILLVLFVLFAGGLVSVNAYLFFEVRSGELFNGRIEDASEAVSIDVGALESAFSLYRERQATYDALFEAFPKLDNPSRPR